MAEQKFCRNCSQERTCRQVYRQLGNPKGPTVVFKVMAAFLLPVMVFIASLAAFEKILAGIINTKELLTAVNFLFSLSVSAVCVLVIRAIERQLGKNK